MGIYYVHVDSHNRDSNMYPSGNSYIMYLQTQIKNPVRADLVSAKVPNSMYNITAGSNTITVNGSILGIPPGFYSSTTLETALTPNFTFLPAQGKFLANNQFTISSLQLSKCLGFPLSSSGGSVTYSAGSISPNVVDFSLNEYVFLDIEEFRTPAMSDAQALPVSSTNTGMFFAPIPMDVTSTIIKHFKECSDYRISAHIPSQTLSRLTVRWYDRNRNLLNFQGYENNAFILRIHTDP